MSLVLHKLFTPSLVYTEDHKKGSDGEFENASRDIYHIICIVKFSGCVHSLARLRSPGDYSPVPGHPLQVPLRRAGYLLKREIWKMGLPLKISALHQLDVQLVKGQYSAWMCLSLAG